MSNDLKHTGAWASAALAVFAVTAVFIDAVKTSAKAELDALSRSANPIALKCAIEGVRPHNQAVCQEALRAPATPVRQAAIPAM